MILRKPKLKLHKVSSLRTPGVYVLYRRSIPVYVGQSQDAPQRIRDHAWPTSENKHAYRGGFDGYAIIRRSDLAARLELEKYLIGVFRPEGNQAQWPSRTEFLRALSDPAFAPSVHPDEEAEIAETASN